MKYLVAACAMIALFSMGTLQASAVTCPDAHGSSGTMPTPPECLSEETKAKHPGWYREGGYCDGAGTLKASNSLHRACGYI